MKMSDIQAMITATVEATVTSILDKLGLAKSPPPPKPRAAPRCEVLGDSSPPNDSFQILSHKTYYRNQDGTLDRW